MANFSYDYEFYFINIYNPSIIDDSNSLDKTNELKELVIKEIEKIDAIFASHNGINTLSCILNHNSYKYKITMHKI